MMRSFYPMFICAALALSSFAPSAGAAADGPKFPQAPIVYDDIESLQRGAAVFVNHCLGCHSAQYLRYGRLSEDLQIPSRQIEELLINNEANLADGMQSAMRAEDGKEWFHQAVPPDLTLVARLRGVDWLYAYMRGFYRDPSRPTGWNNAVFENVAMPHVLSDLQGVYMNGADGAMVQIRPGRLNETEYNEMVGDLVNFLSYAGEPSRAQRVKIGYLVMAFLLMLLLATYFLYREYWREIH